MRLYKRKGIWWIDIRYPGQRIRHSTNTEDKEEAKLKGRGETHRRGSRPQGAAGAVRVATGRAGREAAASRISSAGKSSRRADGGWFCCAFGSSRAVLGTGALLTTFEDDF